MQAPSVLRLVLSENSWHAQLLVSAGSRAQVEITTPSAAFAQG